MSTRLARVAALLLFVPTPVVGQTALRFTIAAGSEASYAVDEVFLRENNRLFTAVGVSRVVTGEFILDTAQPQNTRIPEITVDLRDLHSDSERRDRALREKYLDTRQFPFARLTNGELRRVPERIVANRKFQFTMVGDLAVHGVTRRTSWTGEAELVDDVLRGTARSNVKMSSFGIEVPRLLSLRSEDDVVITIKFVARRSEEP